MSERRTTETAREDEDDETPIGRLYGLSAVEAEAFEAVCKDAFEAMGIAGDGVFDKLRQGESLDIALGFPPGLREVVYGRAHRWFSVGRPDRAEGLFRALCAADPSDADCWVGLGICLRVREDLGSAGLAFDTALRLRPDWAVAEFHACELALRRDDIEEAFGRLGKFRSLSDAQTPPEMAAEASRIEQALLSRRQAVLAAGWR